MQFIQSFIAGAAPSCRNLVQFGVSFWLQTSILILFSMIVAKFLRRFSPTASSFVVKSALAAIILCGFASVFAVERAKPLLDLSLPEANISVQSNLSVEGNSFPFSRNNYTTKVDSTRVETDKNSEIKFSRQPELTSAFPSPPMPPVAVGADIASPESTTLSQIDTLRSESPSADSAVVSTGTAELLPKTGVSGWGILYFAIVGIWVCVASSMLIWMSICQRRVSLLCSRSLPVLNDNLVTPMLRISRILNMRPPSAYFSEEVESPFVCGVFKPKLILPTSMLTEFSSEEVKAALTHELAHLKEGDVRWNLLARLSCVFLWFQPLMWSLWKRIESSEEAVCDQAAIEMGCAPTTYANFLLTLAEKFSGGSNWKMQTGMAMPGSELGGRIESVLTNGGRKMKRLTILQKIGYLSLLSSMMVFAWNAVSAQSKSPMPPESPVVAVALPAVADIGGTSATEALEAPEMPEVPEVPDVPEISIDLNSDDPNQDGAILAARALELKVESTALKAQQAALTAAAAKLRVEIEKMHRSNFGNTIKIESRKEFKGLDEQVRKRLEQASSELNRNFNSQKMDFLASTLSAKALQRVFENKNNRNGSLTKERNQKLEMEFDKLKAKFSEIKQENLLLQKRLEEKTRSKEVSPN